VGFTPWLGNASPPVSSFVGRYSNTPHAGFATSLCRIWRFIHFAGCVQHFRKLELAHAHNEASTMRPPSRSRPQPTQAAPIRSSHSSSRTKVVHTTTPILPSCNYCGNPAHKVSECKIPSEDLFCHYCGKEGHHESVCFATFPERKQLRLQWQNLPTSSAVRQPKAKAPHPST